MFFGIPHYTENLWKITVHYESVVKSRKLTTVTLVPKWLRRKQSYSSKLVREWSI